MEGTYTFTGQSRTGFYAYRDLDTGRMLEAEPGQSYRIGAVEENGTVPPGGDSLWVPTPPEPKATGKAARAASTEGGE